jgi:hypothetical protein
LTCCKSGHRSGKRTGGCCCAFIHHRPGCTQPHRAWCLLEYRRHANHRRYLH